MIPFRAFEVLVDVIKGSRSAEQREYEEFLAFYRDLVKIIPDDIAREFASISAPTIVKKKIQSDYRLELNVTDLLWWQTVITTEGGRFVAGIPSVQKAIWDELNKQVRRGALSEQFREQLIELTTMVPSIQD